LGVLAFALGRIFGASIKSVHLNFFDIAPVNVTFSDAGSAFTETLISLLFYAAGTPIVVFGNVVPGGHHGQAASRPR
jgi:hypothetical protein